MKTKKLFALLLTIAMVLSMGVTALADNNNGAAPETGSIEISNPQDGVDYTAYKIFDTTYDLGSEGTTDDKYAYTTTSEWQADVITYTEGTADTTTGVITGKGLTLTPVKDSAGTIKCYNVTFDSSFNAADFGKAMAAKTSGKTGIALDDQDEGENPKATDLTLGYYMVVPSKPNLPEKLVSLSTTDKDITVNDKNEQPKVEKEIVEASGDVDHNTASVGDQVSFKLTTKVPDMTGYSKYFFVVNDTMSKGLTFNGDDVVVTLNGTPLTVGTDYTVKTENTADGGTEIRIVMKDMIDYQAENVGDPIVITYSATVNEDAVTGTVGNTNTAKVEYSNDPSIKPENEEVPGNPPTDDDDPRDPGYKWNDPNYDVKDPSGDGPESTTTTYVADLLLTKVDENNNTLTGAKFKIEGESAKVVIVNEDIFKESTTGTYYRLLDGTYTTAAPSANEVLADDTYTAFTGEKVTYTKLSPATEVAVGLFYKDGDSYVEITDSNKASAAGKDLYLPTYNTLGLYTAQDPATEITTEEAAKAAALSNATLYTRTINEMNIKLYESTSVKYEKVETITKSNSTESYTREGYVDENGQISFAGLGEGTYKITELIAPDGYNLLKDPITAVVELVDGETTGTYKFQVTIDGGEPISEVGGALPFNVVNHSGLELPETGGIGTTVFYIAGGMLVLFAAIVLITKKRMSAEN